MKIRRVIVFFCAVLLLAGCVGKAAEIPTLVPTNPAPVITIPTASPTPQPARLELPSLAKAQPWNAKEILILQNPLSGLILFTNTESDRLNNPFHSAGLESDSPQEQGFYLWGVSVDGRNFGMLSLDGWGYASFRPPEPNTRLQITDNGLFPLGGAGSSYDRVVLPDFCIPPKTNDPEHPWAPCRDFQFSPDGHYLTVYYEMEACWMKAALFDRQAGQVIFQINRAHWLERIPDGQILYATGHCEGGRVYLYNPLNGKTTELGDEGLSGLHWNPQHNAFFVQVGPFFSAQTILWGYNIETGQHFITQDTTAETIDDPAVWTPDGRQVIYRHRLIQIGSDYKSIAFSQPSQLILVNAWTGKQRAVASDSAYDFHLCDSAHDLCAQWDGDWLPVIRHRFTPQLIADRETMYDTRQGNCLVYARDCPDPAVAYAFNWKTGALLSWEQASPPAPTPTAHPDGPGTQVLYTAPDGSYTWVVGADGESLWLVPRSEAPQKWAEGGRDFWYLP